MGDRDRLVFGVERRARRIRNARVAIVAGGGHIALQDSSNRVNEEVLRFLAGA